MNQVITGVTGEFLVKSGGSPSHEEYSDFTMLNSGFFRGTSSQLLEKRAEFHRMFSDGYSDAKKAAKFETSQGRGAYNFPRVLDP